MPNHSDKTEEMLMNWPERVWIYSPLRPLFLRKEIRKWIRLVGRPELRETLEIGCGLGKGAALLADMMGCRQVAAFDLERCLVERAKRGLPERLASRVSFFAGDAQDLPFPDASFDAVVNFGIIHHVLDWRRCIAELARVLKPGGFFFFEEIYPPLYANFLFRMMLRHPRHDRFDGPQFLEELKLNGLTLVEGVRTDSKFGVVGVASKR